MRQSLKILFLAILLFLLVPGVVVEAGSGVAVFINGYEVHLETPALFQGGRVMVPLRGVLEAMGASVNWDGKGRLARISLGSHRLVLRPGKTTALVDGEEKRLAVAAELSGGRVYIPLRFVGEVLGAGVAWDEAARAVRLTLGNYAGELPVLTFTPREAEAGPYDVLVVGGEPEGVAAAVAAARAGSRVLLMDKHPALGGLFTFGELNSLDMNYGPDGRLLTRGIFQEFYSRIGGDSFDVEVAKQAFLRLVLAEPGITLALNTEYSYPLLAADGKTVLGVAAIYEGRLKNYYAARVIDSTQDADVAAAAGASYTVGGEDIGLKDHKMVATLVLHVGGVKWGELSKALNNDNDRYTGANRVSAWGFLEEMRGYRSSTPRLRMRGLNIGRQKDGSVLINSMQIFGVDGLDPASKEEAIRLGREEAPRVVAYLRKSVPGFREAYLIDTAPELYIRETRHIKGEYILSINDVLENRDFSDRAAMGSYPVDIQPTSPNNYGYVLGKPHQYSVPYRSLVPLKVENLLVAGRSASYSSMAAGSARVVPLGMALGQAAGVAATYSLRMGLTPRQLGYRPDGIKKVQEILKSQGAYLEPFSIPNPYAGHWAYPYVRAVRTLGVISAGYTNDLKLEETITDTSFVNLVSEALRRKDPRRVPDRETRGRWSTGQPLQAERALAFLREAVWGGRVNKKNIIGKDLAAQWPKGGNLSRGQAYALLGDTLEQLGYLEINR